jgi:hypothetical protein
LRQFGKRCKTDASRVCAAESWEVCGTMSHSKRSIMKRAVPRAALAVVLTAGTAVLSVTTTARGASDRQQAAAIELTQTCSNRVRPEARIDIEAVLANTGDQPLTRVTIVADAGTSNVAPDDFVPQLESGDTNGNGVLDPSERWTYGGSYTAPDQDVTNIVDVEAVAPGDVIVDDLAECETDVIETPQPGVIVGVKPVGGRVLVREPGTSKFVELEGTTEIPVGSRVDTTRGVISLTSGLGGGRTNSSQFYSGRFTILQSRARNAFMTLRMDGGNFRVCGGRALSTLSADARRKRPVRRLWGNGTGRFRTRGRYSSATVRGTKWLVQDRCDGTLTRVLRGFVRVRDFRARKNVNVRAGQSYLAKAPG